jgi:hypothetical protein
MDEYIIVNHKCSGLYYQVVSLTEEELKKWVDFFQKRHKVATSWDDDYFEIWEYNENNLGYAETFYQLKNRDDVKEYDEPKNLIETMLVIL